MASIRDSRSPVRDARPPMQDLDMNSPVTFLCYSDSGAYGPMALHFDKGKYIYDKADMSAKVMMPGIDSTERLKKNDVEGALFQCSLQPNETRMGASRDVFWMIDPKYRGKNAHVPDIDQKVGWATVTIPTAGPNSKSYDLWPVRSANGQKAPYSDYRFMYYIQQPRTARRPSRSPAPSRREWKEDVVIRYYTTEQDDTYLRV